MEGPTPEWANVDDYATLEEVFESPDFGHPLPAAAATAGLAAALASTPGTHLLRNRAIALTSVLAATLSVVLGLLFTGPASTPVLSAQHAPPARAGHGAGPVPFTSPTPPAGRAGATTAPTTPPSPSSLGGSQLASSTSSSSSGRGQGTTFGTGTSTGGGTGGAAPATPAPTATLTVLTNNPPTTTTPTAPTQSTATTTTTTTAPPRKTTTPTTSPPRWPTTTTTAPPKVSSGGASGGSGRGSGNSGGSSGCDCNCNGYESSDGGGKRDGTATSTTAAPERAAPARVSARGRAGTW